jgi:mono/diheme cytochrome c family protein
MKSTRIILLTAAILGSATWLLFNSKHAPHPPVVVAAEDPVTRGAYLVKLGGCTDCHTPKLMTPQGPIDDPSRLFAGHPADVVLPPPNLDPANPWGAATAGMTAWTGPWGVSFATNLTPDSGTGIGGWTEKEFIATLRTGKHKGEGRAILPPMPWQPLSEAKDEDLAAIFAYFKSMPAVSNRVPAPLPPVSASR